MDINKYFNESCGRCRQGYLKEKVHVDCPLAVVDRWSLFRDKFRANFVWARLRLVVVNRWSLFGGGLTLMLLNILVSRKA